TQPLADLDVTAATINLNSTGITVDDGAGGATATLTGAVVLGANVTIDTDGAADNSLTFTSTINADDATANDRTLTITAGTGTVTFGGIVGGTQALADLDVTAATINLNSTGITVDDGAGGATATFTGAVVLGANVAIDTDGTNDNSLSFTSTINADDATANNRTLTITAGTGTVTFGGIVGGTQPLADLDVTAATINLNSTGITVDDGAGGATATLTGAVVLGANVTI
ncbi:MAG: hypothetical protein HYY45_12020, partial [Deltaproteobacteria bacterium]|nr:hypothetical protein [Deltaproteobacteria bacterium]